MFQILLDLLNGSLLADWKDGNLPDDFLWYALAKFWPLALVVLAALFAWWLS